ncbi:hypothetical protein [Streptomyces griseosporeus]|uniref:hypothetical protein n=1 Tax=Streptomyces griseosporeus TaxID=1910 RepID=UPI0036FEAF15
MPRTTPSRTTPPRPADIASLFPALRSLARPATRLHPRPGAPTVHDSSVGGPLLWPADEPWPVCAVPHKRRNGHRIVDVRRAREILRQAWTKNPRTGPDPEDTALLAAFRRGRHAPHLTDTDPLPLLAVAQLYAADVPHLPLGGDTDVLQVLWCPYERHGDRHEVGVHLRWRRSADVLDARGTQPEPPLTDRPGLVPTSCVLHPEPITEYPHWEALPAGLRSRIEQRWDADTYLSDLSTAPGWKVGGHINWRLTGPASPRCDACGAGMQPLLTVDAREWDRGSDSWTPLEDTPHARDMGANTPTDIDAGRGQLTIAVCGRNLLHPHGLISQ